MLDNERSVQGECSICAIFKRGSLNTVNQFVQDARERIWSSEEVI